MLQVFRQPRSKQIKKGIRMLLNHPIAFWPFLYHRLFPSPKDYRKRFQMTMREWFLHHEHNIVYDKAHWMGTQILKNPFDMWIYQEMIYKIQPDVLVEIGSYKGGSTLCFAHLMDIIGHGQVVSVDIDRTEYHVSHPRIVTVTGDSAAPEVVAKVRELCKGKTVLVIQDGSHDMLPVLDDLRNYAPLVTKGSYFVVEDTVYDLFFPANEIDGYEGGAYNAVVRFLKEDPTFEPDPECERYLFTNHPRGFLKKVR